MIRIARVTKPQGLQGAFRVELIFDDDRVLQSGRKVQVFSGKTEQSLEIEFFRRQHGRSVMKFRGIDTIEGIESLIGAELQIPDDELPPPENGSFYTFHLKGCDVFTADGEHLGVVEDVMEAGAAPILKVVQAPPGNEELLIPFVQHFLKKVDIAGRRIDVELPEGLRELNR